MEKIDSLRAALTAAMPDIADQPDRLRLWIDQGAVRAPMTISHGFAYTFRLNILIIEMACDIRIPTLAIVSWLRVNQPAALAPNADAFAFDVDILDTQAVDLLIAIDLTQNVDVTMDGDGAATLAWVPEPDPLFDDALGLGGADPVPQLTAVLLREEWTDFMAAAPPGAPVQIAPDGD